MVNTNQRILFIPSVCNGGAGCFGVVTILHANRCVGSDGWLHRNRMQNLGTKISCIPTKLVQVKARI